jgi:uncharacterized protein (TIGR03118 family)
LSLALLSACGGGGGYGGGGGGGGAYGGGAATPPTVSVSIAPGSIVLGQSATLTWSSMGGTACTASGAWSGTEPATGTSVVTPTAVGTDTYTLTCTAPGTSTAKSATLTVTAPSAFFATSLVADSAGTAALIVDTHLVNPWGIAFGATSPVWVGNNGSATSTLYDGNGKAQPTAAPKVVNLSPSPSSTAFGPTGVVFNGSSDFAVSAGATSGASIFIFAGEGGMIAGWSPGVDATHAINKVINDTTGAVYTGLAIANNGTANFLYAADFHNAKVDVFDAQFTQQATSPTAFPFTDATLPAGYAPFNIQALKTGTGGATQLYVTYAKQSPPDNRSAATGAGLGLVDVFDTNGRFVSHFVAAGGHLNAPWGLALAPADFGSLSGTVLVGNFGDGKINAFDPSTGNFVGPVAEAGGTGFAVPGLWGIAFGNDAANQPHNALFYAAGTNGGANGSYGRIDTGSAPTLNAAPIVTVTAPTGTVSGTVNVTATAVDSVAIAKMELFAAGSPIGTVTSAPFTVSWDSTQSTNGTVALTAKATDVDGNVGTGAADVTVGNGAAATTLTQIQASVFTPICSGCHNGSNPPGGALPGAQNLKAGSSFASLVSVASLEQPTLLRVKPGDATNSYLIQKLEGAAGITGSRMPLGGTPLDQATIDQIKSWIASGAPNN